MKIMPTVYPIVEGDGDVKAVPILLKRIASEILLCGNLNCLQPYRLPRNKLLKTEELSRALNFARSKLRHCDPPLFTLVLMDSDADCVKEIVEKVHSDHAACIAMVPTSIVLAVREFEAWFLAAKMNAAQHNSLREDAGVVENPEGVADAKGRFRGAIMKPGRAYSETVDQPKYASCMDLREAQARSTSFDKLVRELRRHLAPR